MPRTRSTLAFCLLGLVLMPWQAAAEVHTETVADGLEHPWAMAFLPDGHVLVTERSGDLLRIDPENGERAAIEGVPAVDARNQGGLLDIQLHPDFAANRQVYLTWSGACGAGNATHLGRGRLAGDRLRDFETLFVATPCVDSTKHFGSRIVFDGDGHLFMTVGERGERDRSQDIGDHNGSVLRLLPDGGIPADNPFVDRDDAEAAIYSYGHRNPQGAVLHPDTGALWIHEHGPRGGDEINLPEPGANFGWPKTTYGKEYWGPEIGPDQLEGTVQPIHYWVPSIAPSGMDFYTGDRFPEWRGDLFIGALALTHLARLEMDGTEVVRETQLLDDRGWRIRDVRTGPDGYLYVLTDAANGRVVRVAPGE
ncbi:PQQ-dependent sugar dehydrogenase [Halofilum ochraceum]|uniref:PQQ-dependent sugar dehydrogenase n=1 Tax=Halofilum ochraceum TaxID=1611323 RepID=UPI00082CBDC7|nr:PQQ-dependent sugar dehydrogenase [Halofilum ochraceum]